MGHDEGWRVRWRRERQRLEARLAEQGLRRSVQGDRRLGALSLANTVLSLILGVTGLGPAALRRAGRVTMERHTVAHPALPHAFDGYTILHVSDLHVGIVPEAIDAALRRLDGVTVDLVALTGDYQTRGWPAAQVVAAEVARLVNAVRPVDGAVATLGNHDELGMAEALEGHGIRVLVNERTQIRRGPDVVTVTGLDDCHAFYTPAAPEALAAAFGGFSLVLSHTPELADVAAAHGHGLYLCGHTHGGQICLPGGRPVFTALDSHRDLASGRWRRGALEGYTSRALGSGPPGLRINCPAEVAVIRLERAGSPPG